MTEPLVSMRSMDRILPLLSGVKHSGTNQATAVCPVCRAGSSNHKHNLSVTYFPEQRQTKTNCFSSECPRSAVLEALGLPPWAAYDDPPRPCEVCEKLTIPDERGRYIHEHCAAKQEGRQVTLRRPRKPRPTRRVVLPKLPDLIAEPPARKFTVLQPYKVVAEWEHFEITGELKARSVRKERTVLFEGDAEPTVEKFIRPHYFDPANGGRWCRTKAESPVESVPLWRLPEVRAAIEAGEPVWGTEGHKAAEAVLEMGGCGTSVLLGALDPATAEGLAGADFRYICDRDATGYSKGIKAMKASEGLAARRSLWLPAVDEPGADADDHLKAGYGLDQLIPTDIAHLEVLEVLAIARGGRASNGRLKDLPVEREARAWLARAEAAAERGDGEAADGATTNAHLWVRAAGQRLRQLLQLSAKLQQLEAASESDLAEMASLVADGAVLPRRLYEEFGVDVDEDLVAALAPPAPPAPPPPSPPASDGADYDDEDDPTGGDGGPDATVYAFPAPEQEQPKWTLSVPGDWRYDDGSIARRGVYCTRRRDDPFYTRMARLPYVHYRILRRDGRGNVTAVDYVLSATQDGPQLTVTRDELGDGRWANRLGIPLSWDPKVRQAAATAIEDYAARVAPERESIPRIGQDSGLLELPVDLCDQYFHTAPCSREEGLQLWREIVDEAATAPKLAHLVSASSIGPYSRSISRTLAHWVSLTGPMGRGKSQALKLAAGVWGDSATRDTAGYLYGSWSASHQAVPQMLGELNVMPTFLDEAGAAGFTKAQWGQLVYRISLGANRKRTNIRDGRVSQDRAWHSILFTSANDDLTAGIDSGAFQGTIRRVIEILAPPTTSAEQGNRLVNDEPLTPGLLQRCYGHLGLQIAETVTVSQAVQYLQRARILLPAPAGDVQEIAALLQLHLAGAVMIDDVLGTGQKMTNAALQSVQDVLAAWLPGQSEGDRVLDRIRESTNAEPLAWPTLTAYDDAFSDLPGTTTDRHRAMMKDLYGLRRDDEWIAVLPSHWRRFLAETGVSPQQAQAELEDRGLLIRNESAKNRDHTYQTTQRFGRGRDSKVQRVYKVFLPEPDDQDDLDIDLEPPTLDPVPSAGDSTPAPTGGVTGNDPADERLEVPPNPPPTRGVTGVTGSVSEPTAGVTAPNRPLTRGVTGVTGSPGPHARVDAHDGAGAREATPGEDGEEPKMGTRYLDRGGFAGWSSSLETSQACVVCGVISSIAMDHMPIHPLCWERSTRSERAQRIAELSAKSPSVGGDPGGWTALPQPYPDCAVCGTPAGQALAGLPLHHGDCEDELARRQQPAAPVPTRAEVPHKAATGPRFVADSAVLDVDGGWLSTGEAIALPDPISHMGDIHAWALESRLGYGGNRNHYPEPGHVWLSPALCAQLGLPTGPFATMAEADQALAEMRQSPFLVAAEAAGWTVTVDAKQPWLRLRRDRRTVIITGVGWGCGRYDLLLHGDPSAPELAGRLGYLCRLLGYPYTVSPANTGLLTLAYHTTHGLPPIELPATVEFNDVAANPSWFDADTVTALAAQHPDWWVHEYDRRASYAAASGSAVLGTGPGLHHPDGCEWDKRVAGLYRIAPLDMPVIPQLPGFDPRDPKGEGQASGWLSRSAVQWLFELGGQPEILEAYTWAESGAQLKSWQAMIRDARQSLDEGVHEGNPHAVAVQEAGLLKGIYAGAIGKLASTNGRPLLEPSWRYYPHWRAEIIGTHTVNTLRAVLRIHKTDPQHRLPVAIGNTDAVVYVGSSPDPADVWPVSEGPDALSSPALGKFKPVASIQLGRWLEVIGAEQNATKPRSRLQLIAKAGREWT